jgi:hypothetical protein
MLSATNQRAREHLLTASLLSSTLDISPNISLHSEPRTDSEHLSQTSSPSNMTSSRADLDRLSFLDLPAEVRNEVYGYAFEHPSPIVITFSEQVSGSVTLHRYIGDSNHELPLLRSRPDNAYLPKAQALVVDSRGELRQIYTIVRPCDTIQAFPMGLPFFQTCRQVHDEASSSFYSNNTFLIMQKRLGCATKHGKKCDLAGRVLELWCRQIRAYIKLVKHLWLANLYVRNI